MFGGQSEQEGKGKNQGATPTPCACTHPALPQCTNILSPTHWQRRYQMGRELHGQMELVTGRDSRNESRLLIFALIGCFHTGLFAPLVNGLLLRY